MGGFKKYSINEHMRESTINNFTEEIQDMIMRIESFQNLTTTDTKQWYLNGSLHHQDSSQSNEIRTYEIQEALTKTIHHLKEANHELTTL